VATPFGGMGSSFENKKQCTAEGTEDTEILERKREKKAISFLRGDAVRRHGQLLGKWACSLLTPHVETVRLDQKSREAR
jgi:hypothetical protein